MPVDFDTSRLGYSRLLPSCVCSVHSVLNSPAAWSDPFVLSRVNEADAIFFAGGNQFNYAKWEGSPLQAAVNDAVSRRGVPVGATSAGCAIQGQFVFTAAHDTIYSHEALRDPYK